MLVRLTHFNSIKVRLELEVPEDATDDAPLFQFHKGAIRTFIPQVLLVQITHFNSIKVRLERSSLQRLFCSSQFQFHKGAIRTLRQKPEPKKKGIFQFHKGAIRTFVDVCASTNTLVFQFHKGAIRTCGSKCVKCHVQFISIP